MTRQELENRLRNFETLTFSNETDVFEFKFSKIRGNVFRVIRNGSFRPNKSTISEIMTIIRMRNLEFEEF